MLDSQTKAFQSLVEQHADVVVTAERLNAVASIQSDTLALAKRLVDKLLPLHRPVASGDKE